MSIDFESYIEKWAWRKFKKLYPHRHANRCTISWHKIKLTGDLKCTIVKSQIMDHAAYRGTFTNSSTKASADHAFNLDATMNPRSNVTFTGGMTKNLPKLLTVELPEEIKQCSEDFSSVIELDTNECPLTQSERFKLLVDSKVSNPPGSEFQANVKMNEHILAGTFVGLASLSGTIAASYYDNSTFVEHSEEDICNIPEYIEHEKLRREEKKKALVWDMKGSFRFIFDMQHDFELDNVAKPSATQAANTSQKKR